MERKIGEGHAGAMFRLGLKELRNALNPSRESVADNEIGLYGTLTQGEIAKARGGFMSPLKEFSFNSNRRFHRRRWWTWPGVWSPRLSG